MTKPKTLLARLWPRSILAASLVLTVVSDGGDPIIATEIHRCIESTPLDPFPDFIEEGELRVRPVIFFLYGY